MQNESSISATPISHSAFADGAQESYAFQAIVDSPELYDAAIANNKI